MFSITEEAEIYVADLFEQQDEKDLGLKVDVEKAGTPVATVTFNLNAFSRKFGSRRRSHEYSTVLSEKPISMALPSRCQ